MSDYFTTRKIKMSSMHETHSVLISDQGRKIRTAILYGNVIQNMYITTHAEIQQPSSPSFPLWDSFDKIITACFIFNGVKNSIIFQKVYNVVFKLEENICKPLQIICSKIQELPCHSRNRHN